MSTWFQCKVKYEKIDETSGLDKKVSEAYLFDALSFTEAESRIHKELETMIRGEFVVTNISKANYTDLFPYDEGDKWYKVKVAFMSVDEKSGKEKKVANTMLVMANNVKQAYERIEESLGGMAVDFDILSIMDSNLMDVFPYFDGEEKRKSQPQSVVAKENERMIDEESDELDEE